MLRSAVEHKRSANGFEFLLHFSIDAHLCCMEDRIIHILEFSHGAHSELRRLCFLNRSKSVVRVGQDSNEQTEKDNGSDEDERSEQYSSPDDKKVIR